MREKLESVLLEELEGLDSSSTVGEQQTQIILSYSFPRNEDEDEAAWSQLWARRKEHNLSYNTCKCMYYRILERWSVADGGKMFWKFLDPGFLKRWRGEPEKSVQNTNIIST